METRRQDSDIISHQFRGQQGGRYEERQGVEERQPRRGRRRDRGNRKINREA